jgi:hypothetical protein
VAGAVNSCSIHQEDGPQGRAYSNVNMLSRPVDITTAALEKKALKKRGVISSTNGRKGTNAFASASDSLSL